MIRGSSAFRDTIYAATLGASNVSEISFNDSVWHRFAGPLEIITPPQLTATSHNYNPTGFTNARYVRLSSNARRTITGLAVVGVQWAFKTLINVGNFPITLTHADSGSATTSQFQSPVGAHLVLNPGEMAKVGWDSTIQRWLLFSETTDGYGAVTALTGAANTLGSAHIRRHLTVSHTSNTVLTIPTNANDPIPIGTLVPISAIGAGTLEVAFEVGVTLNVPPWCVPASSQTNAKMWLHKTAVNTWELYGDLMLVPRVLRPTQIAANQNDYAPTGWQDAELVFLRTDASRNITGFVQPDIAGATYTQYGRYVKHLVNDGSFDWVLKHQDAGSTAANRLICDKGADLTVTPGTRAMMVYDPTADRWRAFYVGSNVDVQPFTSSGTWNKPPNVRATSRTKVICISPGGGGGGGARVATGTACSGGAGGGAGAYADADFLTSDLGATVTVTIGTGGTGGTGATTNTAGGNGNAASGATSFGSGQTYAVVAGEGFAGAGGQISGNSGGGGGGGIGRATIATSGSGATAGAGGSFTGAAGGTGAGGPSSASFGGGGGAGGLNAGAGLGGGSSPRGSGGGGSGGGLATTPVFLAGGAGGSSSPAVNFPTGGATAGANGSTAATSPRPQLTNSGGGGGASNTVGNGGNGANGGLYGAGGGGGGSALDSGGNGGNGGNGADGFSIAVTSI